MAKSSNNNKSFIRQWKILKMIVSSPFGKTIKELSEDFQVSTKTIRRDMELLDSILNIFQTKNEKYGEKRFSFETMFLTLAINLTQEEILSFNIGQKMMTPLVGSYFQYCYDTGYEKIKRAGLVVGGSLFVGGRCALANQNLCKTCEPRVHGEKKSFP